MSPKKRTYLLTFLLISLSCFSNLTRSSTNGDSPVIKCPTKDFPQSAKFVYCGPAICTPAIKSDGSASTKTAICDGCTLLNGQNFGTSASPCEARVPTVDSTTGQIIYISSFTPRTVLAPKPLKTKASSSIDSMIGKTTASEPSTRQPLIFCHPDGNNTTLDYADCLGAACTMTDHKSASCTCKIAHLSAVSSSTSGASKDQSFATQTRSCALPDKCVAAAGTLLNGVPAVVIADALIADIVAKDPSTQASDLVCKRENLVDTLKENAPQEPIT